MTRKMQLHGYREEVDRSVWDYVYGSDADQIAALIENDASLGELLHIGYTFRVAHVIWAVREERLKRWKMYWHDVFERSLWMLGLLWKWLLV